MRQITRDAADAFLNRRPMGGRNNTAVSVTDGVATLTLHGHPIAWHESDGVAVTLAGWGTVTTRERLNGLLSMMGSDWRFCQIDHEQHLRNVTDQQCRFIGAREVAIVSTGERIEIGGAA